MALSFRHLVSASQVTRPDADFLMERAGDMKRDIAQRDIADGVRRHADLLHDELVGLLFYEPSTRTSISFEAATKRLGGNTIVREGIHFSSLTKGETPEDTYRVVAANVDALVMRHPQAGAAAVAARRLDQYREETKGRYVPFINAGDGNNEHPTQALLDLFTIEQECDRIDHLHVAMAGDLKNGRTVHSLTKLLTLYPGTRFTFASPEQLRLPESLIAMLRDKDVEYTEVPSLDVATKGDVLYMTRVQKERFNDMEEYERLKDVFRLTMDMVEEEDVVILHPLPRVGEIATDIDELPNAAYFRQADNGVPMRAALLATMLGK